MDQPCVDRGEDVFVWMMVDQNEDDLIHFQDYEKEMRSCERGRDMA